MGFENAASFDIKKVNGLYPGKISVLVNKTRPYAFIQMAIKNHIINWFMPDSCKVGC